MRLTVRETLASRVLDGKGRTFPIVDAERDAVIEPEIEFRQIPVKVLLGAVLIDAAHTPLEDAEIAFGRVGVDVAAHVFAG